MKILLIVVSCVVVIGAVVALLVRRPEQPSNSGTEPDSPKSVLDHPRYKENPMNLFFEDYILDVMGQLPQEDSLKAQQMDLKNVFNTEASNWKEVVREVLHLSDTIDIAILDLWYRNSEIGKEEEMEYDPRQFAMDFVDHFFEEDSKVDVWGPGALEAAKERIRGHQER